MDKLLTNSPVIILVEPQMGENIGASARAMKNFGLSELRIVNPRDGWPNPKAQSMAVGAVDIVDKALVYNSLPEAVADIEYLYASTSTPRDMNKDYVLSRNLKIDLSGLVKTAIMFGRENCGLTNDEITLANRIITIDTAKFCSLNIAHSVAIVCYEIFQQQFKGDDRPDLTNSQQPATKEELSYFLNHLVVTLEQKNFFKVPQKKQQMSRNITNIFSRIDKLSKTELQTLMGIVNTLTKK